jgi:acid phosphatase type 7
MKKLAFLIVLLLLFSLTAPTSAASPAGIATATPDHITLTWTANPATTMTVTWRTDTTVTSALVQYQAGDKLSGKPQSASATQISDLDGDRLFTATLAGLTPHTPYCYRVGNGRHWSETHRFVTADPKADSFKFLIFGDSQSGIPDKPVYGPWQTTVHNAYAANPGAKFLVNVGDLVEIGEDPAHWRAWFAAAKGVIDTIPEMAVEGNHETYISGHWDTRKPSLWRAQFQLPQNGPAILKGQVYSYDYGPVHFVVLDSQEAEESPTCGDVLAAQKTWLAADLAASQATWKIVFFHKPPYYLKASRTNEAIKAAFCPILDKYHADLVFNGHDHAVARTYAINRDTFQAKPSQGTIYYATGRSGNKVYPDLSQKYWDTVFFDPQDQPDYLVVTVAGPQLTVKTVKQDNTLVDTFVIDKKRDWDSDSVQYPIPTTAWEKFSKPALAIFGNLLPPTMSHHAPLLKDGVWFVEAQAFAAYVGGRVSLGEGKTTLAIGGKQIALPVEQMLEDNGVLLVSVEALKAFDFSATFHPENNILSLTQWQPGE